MPLESFTYLWTKHIVVVGCYCIELTTAGDCFNMELIMDITAIP